ncbi:S1 family peptidase [Stenotrophomonas rhizophila]|uniref:S1 family peptidase n=1 Tax=Stenotrophomonas rhizophila TaxID=216778 RepID=UPI001E490F6E|nr:serine protease [Stenotrophomonas rhizophila]MCC7634490.1 serine protease [Stenotrophomonas rhizophila]MCC7663888.1 serine protease [Stenotrophomonas rhizophila]
MVVADILHALRAAVVLRAQLPHTRVQTPTHSICRMVCLSVLLLAPLVALAADEPVQPRIIGGVDVPVGDYPFTVSIQLSLIPGHFCGGALISDREVVTAAHCYGTSDPTQLFVVVGRTDLTDPTSGQVRKVIARTIHPLASAPESLGSYDFAILELDEPVVGIEPVALAPLDMSLADGETVRALGWGWVNAGDPDSGTSHLQMVDIPIVDTLICQASHEQGDPDEPKGTVNPETDICAGDRSASVCFGDSGGPLLVWHPARHTYLLAGIVSRGKMDCPSAPGIFTSMMSRTLWETMP